jgi:hypothetical protein
LRSFRNLLALGLIATLAACGGSSNNASMGATAAGPALLISPDPGSSADCAGLMPGSTSAMVASPMGGSCTDSPMNMMGMGDMPASNRMGQAGMMSGGMMSATGMMSGTGTTSGDGMAMPMPMPASSGILAAGIDSGGLELVIQDGSAVCSGCIVGQWFDSLGLVATSSFTLLNGFDASSLPMLDTAPLIGGGLAIRQINPDGTTRWLAALGPSSMAPRAAPAWLGPDTSLAIVRDGRAYAVLPGASAGGSCSASVAVFSPAGNHCGTLATPDDGAMSCTSGLGVSTDGTLVQPQPAADGMTCMLRSWPGALK